MTEGTPINPTSAPQGTPLKRKNKEGGERMQAAFSGAEAEGNEGLSWDTPSVPHKYANVVVVKNTVALVRHHYAESGDVEAIFNEYLDDKTGEK